MPPQKKKPSIEYRLFITPRYDETRKKETTLFLLETIKEFSTFRYSIVVRHAVNDKAIRLDILGLKTPELTMPAFGSAREHIEIDDLRGTYDVSVAKLDGGENHFSLKVTKKGVSVEYHPSGKFITVYTDPAEWKSIHSPQPEKKQ
jgi:hypothetical protein